MLDQGIHIDILGHGGLSQDGLKDLAAAALIGQGNVDQLVKPPGAQQGGVNDVRPTGRRTRLMSGLQAGGHV